MVFNKTSSKRVAPTDARREGLFVITMDTGTTSGEGLSLDLRSDATHIPGHFGVQCERPCDVALKLLIVSEFGGSTAA